MKATANIKVLILRTQHMQFLSAEGIPHNHAEVQIKVEEKYYE